MNDTFKSQAIESINYVLCPQIITKTSCAEFSRLNKSWVIQPMTMHVLDFKLVDGLHDEFLQAMSNFKQDLDNSGKQLMSINMSEKVFKQIKTKGMEKVFNRQPDYQESLSPKVRISFNEIKRTIGKYLVTSSFEAFRVTLNTTVSADSNYVLVPVPLSFDEYDMVALISVKSPYCRMNLRLCFRTEVLKQLSIQMVGCEPEEVDEEVIESTATELLNLIYGQAKSHLNDDVGLELPAAIPELVRPENFKDIHRSGIENITVIPMVTPLGAFHLEVEIFPPE